MKSKDRYCIKAKMRAHKIFLLLSFIFFNEKNMLQISIRE
jgi:hypothetical protein